MRLIFVAVLVITSSSFLVFGKTKDPGKKQGGNVEQTLTGIEQELTDALLKNDVSPSQKYLADTYVFTAPDGEVMDKTRSIADLKSGDLKFEASKVEDMKVRLHGDTAIVTYATTDKGSYKGKDISGHYRWTDVFIKRNGNWQLVAGHGAPIAKQ